MNSVTVIVIAITLVVIAGPLLAGLTGLIRARHEPPVSLPRWRWQLTIASALLYVLAFNLTFFIQELFLVLPKALTPGLRPTLFHNNHSWQGDHALSHLFQGTGALAVLIVGSSCMRLLRSGVSSPVARLFLIWMAYNGCFQALPQVVVGAINPQNDVGMAMDYFQMSATAKTVAALVALVAMPLVASWLAKALLGVAESPALIATARARTRFIFLAATLPALIAIVAIIPFRLPRELIEVVILPVIVTVTGLVWIQATAWRYPALTATGHSVSWPLARLVAAVIGLLLVFQLVLKPGIQFF